MIYADQHLYSFFYAFRFPNPFRISSTVKCVHMYILYSLLHYGKLKSMLIKDENLQQQMLTKSLQNFHLVQFMVSPKIFFNPQAQLIFFWCSSFRSSYFIKLSVVIYRISLCWSRVTRFIYLSVHSSLSTTLPRWRVKEIWNIPSGQWCQTWWGGKP